MTQPEIRRASDPRIVRKLQTAIRKTCEQKQSPSFERIYRAITGEKVQLTRSRIEMQLKNSIHDGLIVESTVAPARKPGGGTDGNKMVYKVPTLENFYEVYEDDGHDWYCWVCHREGEVYLCTRCPRVIHKKCAELNDEELEDDFVCYCCEDLESTKQYGKKELQELAKMLGYTVERMKSKCEELWKSPSELEEPSYKLFIYQDTNLMDLERKVNRKEFDSLAKFHYEIEWLFHNAVIFYGGENKITNLARIVVLDGQNELSQIDICSECYIRSNDRAKNWFCTPCKPPHRIVYAKLGNDPAWPAKVLRENEDGSSVDVRFFGPPYQRAWIPIRNIWAMDDRPTMKKRTKALAHAEDELKTYLRLLGNAKKKVKNKVSSDVSDDDDEEEEEEVDEVPSKTKKIQDSDDPDDEDYEATIRKVAAPARKKQKKKTTSSSAGRGKKQNVSDDDISKAYGRKSKNQKASEKFRQLQEERLKQISKNKECSDDGDGDDTENDAKSDINHNDDMDDMNENESSDLQLAKQIKMTDDYKMIEKLQERVRQLEKLMAQSKEDYESAQSEFQSELENVQTELAAEREVCKSLKEELDRNMEIDVEKIKNDILMKKQDEIEAAVEEERKRNELEFEVRLNEALTEERNNAETKLQESLEKERTLENERASLDAKVKTLEQRGMEMQHTFDRFKTDMEKNHQRSVEENVRKAKIDSEQIIKRTMEEAGRRFKVDSERLVGAAKKKSWCSNCTKEAFYHCCWNTNYCSTECQRVHWVTHRYQCTREMMSTCRSCQQRQNFPGNFASSSQVPPK